MPDAYVVEWIREKFVNLAESLDELGRSRWAAIEARSLGHGGIAAVAEATGMSDRTIRTGIKELESGESFPPGRQRRHGAGRRSRREEQPSLLVALDKMIAPTTRGEPTNPLRWTCKSTRTLAEQLRSQGFEVSATTVRGLLVELGYSLQGNRKTREGKQHPDRDAQFEHINARVRARKYRGEPALSVDTKRRKRLETRATVAKSTNRRVSHGRQIRTISQTRPKARLCPMACMTFTVTKPSFLAASVTTRQRFAVAAIRLWWKKLGKKQYRSCKRLLVTADSGGSNSSRSRLWKLELQRLADQTGLIGEVCHYPPGTSKWNKIEHRLFCHITRNWRGVPLETHEVVVSSIGNTRTASGLEIHVWLDRKTYQKGIKVSNEALSECVIKRNDFHGEWNYEIHPRQSSKFGK